jgi:thymidylate kinase
VRWFDGDPGPLVIELTGGPGAGKTTLLPHVLQAVVDNGLAPLESVRAARTLAARTRPGRAVVRWLGDRNRDRALWSIYVAYATILGVRLSAFRPELRRVLLAQTRRPREAMVSERHVVRWFIRHAGTERLFRRFGAAGEVLVVDEGYVHRVVQLFTSAVERADLEGIRRYLEQVPAPTLLVVVDAPANTAWRRIQSRGIWPRMSGMDETAVAAFVRHASEAVGFASSCARESGWQVATVDNTSDGGSLTFDLPGTITTRDASDE